MRLFTSRYLFRIFIILIVYNSLILCGSQYFVYTKHWDLYWFLAFFYREIMLCVSYFAIFLFLAYLPRILSNIIAFIMLILSAIAFIVDIFLLYTFDTNLNSYLVIVALETNPSESADFFHNYLTLPLFGIYALFVALGIFIWRIIPPNLTISKKYVNIIYAHFVAGIATLAVMIYTELKPLNEYWSDVLYHSGREIYRAIEKTRNFIEEYKQLNDDFDTLANTFKPKAAKHPIKNIVLIIGESAQRDKWSLYGYPLPTTPRLDKQKHNENLLVFNDIVAPHAQTHESLSLTLTFANQENTQGTLTNKQRRKKEQNTIIKPWYKYLNIIDAMKLGGYYSIAISNQEPLSVFGNAAATILKRADKAIFVNINDKMSTTKFDESILPILDDVHKNISVLSAENADKPRFYVIHLMGNHAKYYNRYPSEFAYFSPEDVLCVEAMNTKGGNNSLEENMHYLNSVLYGDFILNEIIRRFVDEDSIVIFFGDHGEEIYDWRNFIGHSDSKISRFMAEIPFIIYVSESFKAQHSETYKRLKSAQNRPYMNDDFMHTLLDIADIKMGNFERARSLIAKDASFLKNRLRLVGVKGNERDYDKELKHQKSYLQQGLCKLKTNIEEKE